MSGLPTILAPSHTHTVPADYFHTKLVLVEITIFKKEDSTTPVRANESKAH
jgi:hypothetical protein